MTVKLSVCRHFPRETLPNPKTVIIALPRNGEVDPTLAERRNRTMGIDMTAKRQQRQDLVQLAKPQEGVNDLKGEFARPAREIPGGRDKRAGAPVQ